MKKIWAILVCLLLVGSVALTALAVNDTKVTVTADKTTVSRGDTVKVTVSLSGSDPFTSIGYIQDRDSEYFTVSKGVIQPALEESAAPTIKSFSKSSGFAAGGFQDFDTEEYVAVTVNGDILVMTITINDNAPFGSFQVTDLVNIMNGIAEVPYTLVEDTITVVCDHRNCEWSYLTEQDHVKTCADCSEQQAETAPHTWGSGKVTVAPSVSAEGEMTYTCTDCGGKKTESIPKLEVPSAAGDTKFYVTADKTTVGRGETVTLTVSMSGTDPFTSMGYLHNRDSQYFTVTKGVPQSTLEDPGAPSVKNFTKNGGLAVGGYTDYDTEEDIAVTINGDILVLTITVKEDAPLGKFTVTHSVSAKNGANALEYELFEDTITVVCKHSYTATNTGDVNLHFLICSGCGDTQTESHSWDAGKVTTEPTVEAEGVKTFSCACGATKTQSIPKLDPPSLEVNTTFTVKADKTTVKRGDTVTVEILLEGTDLLTSLGYIPNNDSPYFTIGRHTFGDALDEPGAASIKTFSKKAGLAVAGYTDYDTEADISVTINGVILSFPITIKADAPFGDFTVTKSANIKNASNQVLFHLVEDTITVICEHPNSSYSVLDETNHKLSCPDCGFADVAQHTWDAGKVTAEPTCKDTGVMTYTCECGGTKTESLPITNVHTFGDWEPVDGNTHSHTCSVCQKTEIGTHSYTQGKCVDCGWLEPYVITFLDENGTELSTAVYHYGDTVTEPTAPTKAASKTFTYAFAGWDKAVVAVTGDATYTATYTATYIDYTVIFVNEDGAELSKKTYHYGDTVTLPVVPTKAADKIYSYSFAGWDKAVVAVEGDATYTATYTATYIDYTVTFAFPDGTVIATAIYHYGDTVTVPADPTKEADAVGSYTFTGWDKEIVAVEGDTTYTALFDCEHNDPDLDGTGKVTDADAIYLLRFTLFPEDYPAHEEMMDVNNDGQVTDADAIYLLRHTLFPEDYPLYPKKES